MSFIPCCFDVGSRGSRINDHMRSEPHTSIDTQGAETESYDENINFDKKESKALEVLFSTFTDIKFT